MKALIQRVGSCDVKVEGREVASTGKGLLVLLGVEKGDTGEDLDMLVRKVANLRIFEDAEGKMNLSIIDIAGEAMVVSQFTLAADTRKGNRPSFANAEEPERAQATYLEFAKKLGNTGIKVLTGEFAAHMEVSLVNDGPVTIMLDSRKEARG